MDSSMLAGVSGLQGNQELLDVVGNNLANLNTTGFKGSRVTFADVISDTLSPASGPGTSLGGTNPVQIGLGVKIGAIDTNLSQGGLQQTGRNMDLALQGNGYFVVNDGSRDLYTRAGSFGLDARNNLVQTSSGLKVQSVSGKPIVIDPSVTVPANATTVVNMAGNLDATASPPVQEVVGSLSPFAQGTHATLAGASSQPFALADGDTMTVKVNGGAAQTITFHAAQFAAIGSATAAEVAAAVNSQASGVTASVTGTNGIQLQSSTNGVGSTLQVADGTGGPAALLGLSTTLTAGTETAATAATPLDSLPQTSKPYVAGDTILVSGSDADGKAVSATFVYGSGAGQNGTTLGALATFIGGVFPASSVAIQSDGTLTVTANATGISNTTLSLTDGAADVGATTFSNLPFVVKTPGGNGGQASAGITVYDSQGRSHDVTLTFTKVGASTWDLKATLPSKDGTITDGSVQGITFNDDGSFSRIQGTGVGDANLSFTWPGIGTPQTFRLAFGTPGATDGMTQFGGSNAAIAGTQDGYAAGSLSSLSVKSDGTIQGVFTNGQTQSLAQLEVATFTNPEGLDHVGNSLLAVTTNSGQAVAGTAGSGGAGAIEAGFLEGSNVDVSLEFTQMIIAQRGYQVNAQTITAANQMMQVLANLGH